MDSKTIELYCKYIIKPLEKQKSQLEKEILNTNFLKKFMKKKELISIQKMLDEKLAYLSEMIYGKEIDI